MSSPGDELFRVIAGKVGLGEDIDRAIKKASEVRRLVRLKTGSTRGGLSILNETALATLSLDVAASSLGLHFEKKTAVTMSCVSKAVYASSLRTIEALLGMEKETSVASLAGALSLPTSVANLATSYLHRYRRANPSAKISHPMYPCAAVIAAAKEKRVRLKKGAVVDASRVRPSDLESLVVSMSSLPSDGGRALVDKSEDLAKESERAVSVVSRDVNEEKEDYDEWKERLLRF